MDKKFYKSSLLLFILFLFTEAAIAGSQVSYHGRILKPDGTALISSSVDFKLQVRSTGVENCLLYEEVQNKNMAGSDGVFAVTLNDGSGTRTDSTGYSFEAVFSNRGIFSLPTQCTAPAVSWTPSVTAGRKLFVSFKDTSMPTWENMPVQALNLIPQAIEAQQVGGYTAADLLKVNDSGSIHLNQTNLEAAFTGSSYTNLQAILAGNFVGQTTGAGASLPSVATNPTTPAVGSIWFNTSDNTIKYYDGAVKTLGVSGSSISGITTTADITVNGTASSSISSGSATLGLANTGVSAGSYAKVTVDAKGRVTAGATLVQADIPSLTTAGKVSGDAINSGTIGGSAAISTTGNIATSGSVTAASMSTRILDLYDSDNSNRIRMITPATGVLTADYQLVFPSSAGTSGYVLSTDGSGNLSWVSPMATVSPSTAGNVLTSDGSAWVSSALPIATTAAVGVMRVGTGLSVNASGVVAVDPSAVNAYVQNGNSFGAPAYLGTNDANPLHIETSGVPRMTVDATGNVGIGTTAPGKLLQIGSGTTASVFGNPGAIINTNSWTQFSVKSGGGGGELGMITGDATKAIFGTFTGHDIEVRANNTPYMTIKTTGNIGIGTTSPFAPLEVNRTLAGGAPATSGSADTNVLSRLQSNVVVLDTGVMANGNTWLQNRKVDDFSVNYPLLLNANGGFVGIGLTTPGANLDVKDTIRLSGSTSGYVGLKAAAAAGSTTYTLPSADGSANQVLTTNGSGLLSWTTASGSGAGVTTIGTFNTTSTANGLSVSGNSIFMHAADGTNPGAVSTSAQTFAGSKTFINDVVIDNQKEIRFKEASGGGTEYIGIKAPAALTASYNLTLPTSAGSSGHVLSTDGSGNLSWVNAMSSVSPSTAGNVLTSDGSAWVSSALPIATTAAVGVMRVGTGLAVTASGIVSADFGAAAGKVTEGNDKRLNPAPAVADALKVVRQNALGDGYEVITAAALMGSANVYVQNGNSFGAPAYLGTNDANPLHIETSGNTRMTIDTTGNVGIGTTTPASNLHVVGAFLSERTYAGNYAKDSDAASIDDVSGLWGFQDQAANHAGGYGISGGELDITNNSTTKGIRFRTNAGSTRMTIDVSGNVGIGTTAPGAALDVKDTVRISGSTSGYVGFKTPAAAGSTTYTLPSADGSANQALVTNGSGTLSWATMSGSGGATFPVALGSANSPSMNFSGDLNTGFFSPGADTVAISTSGTERMRIDSSGRIGVGITNPTAKLDIAGYTPTTNTAQFASFGIQSYALNNGSLNENAYFDGVNTVYRSTGYAGIFQFYDGNINFLTAPSGTAGTTATLTNRLMISNSGNVGIGTTNPGAKLEVKDQIRIAGSTSGYVGFKAPAAAGSAVYTLPSGDGSANQVLATNGSGVLSWATISGSGGAGLPATDGSAATPSIAFSLDANTGLFRPGNDAIAVSTSGIERMRVNASGYVGIGTTSPTKQLHIANPTSNATMMIQAGTSSTNPELLLTDSSANGYTLFAGNNTNRNLYIGSVASGAWAANLMTISSSGNVGIGTVSPGAPLDVMDTIRVSGSTSGYVGFKAPAAAGSTTYILPSADGASGQMLTTNGSGTLTWSMPSTTAAQVSAGNGSAGAPSIAFSGDTDTGFYSAGANQIGIAASGAQVFTIGASGLVSPTTGGASVSTANGTASAPTFSFAGDTDTGWFRPAADTLAAATSGAERIRINPSGNVGIGTTNPGAPLNISGSGGVWIDSGTDTRLAMWSDTSNNYSSIESHNYANTVKRPLIFNAWGGNVGIGTTAPNSTLQVGPISNTLNGTLAVGSTSGQSNILFASKRESQGAGDSQHVGGIFAEADSGWVSKLHFKVNNNWGTPTVTGLTISNSAGSGYVGIGTISPRTALDTGTGTMSGAANDYIKAQFTVSGGGTVTWGGPGGKLKWTARFIAIPMSSTSSSSGYIDIDQPVTNIPSGQVYNGVARTADANGVVLNSWEALYAVHTPGGNNSAISYQIVTYTSAFNAPSNWLLVAAVNGDDSTVKLGTGAILKSGGTYVVGSDPSYVLLSPSSQQSGNININGSGFFGGNVGIGTTAPGYKLDVRNSGWGSARFQSTGANDSAILIDAAQSGQNKLVRFTTNNAVRWDVGASAVAESGSNAGSDFFFNRFSDAGTYLGTAFSITRATGNATFANNLTVAGNVNTTNICDAAGGNCKTPASLVTSVTGSLGYTPVNKSGDTSVGTLDFTAGNHIRFGHANQSDGNDGKIGAGLFGEGLNIVGTQTVAASGRKIQMWGDLWLNGSSVLANNQSYRIRDSGGTSRSILGVDASNTTRLYSGGGTMHINPDQNITTYINYNNANSVYIGNGATTTTHLYISNGNVNANALCDAAGNNCKTPSSIVTSVTGSLGYTPLANTSGSGLAVSYAGSGGPNVYNAGGGASMLTFHRVGDYAVNFGLDTDNQLKVGGWSMGNVSYKLWHEGNDGAGSSLDADLLDGLSSASFARSDAATIDQWLSFRVIRNVAASGDGMYIGYGNSNSATTKIYSAGSTNGHYYSDASGNIFRNDGATYLHTSNLASGHITTALGYTPLRFDAWVNNHYFGSDGSHYAKIFRDTDDGNYYMDPNAHSEINRIRTNTNWDGYQGGLVIKGNAPAITFDDTDDGRRWMIHNNSDILYFHRAATLNGTDWASKFQVHNDGNIWTPYFGYLSDYIFKKNDWQGSSLVHTDGRHYGTIFYDTNDTNYYVDPNGTSSMAAIRFPDGSVQTTSATSIGSMGCTTTSQTFGYTGGTVNCAAGKTMMSGGASCGSDGGGTLTTLVSNYPNGNGWSGWCWNATNGNNGNTTVYVRCCN